MRTLLTIVITALTLQSCVVNNVTKEKETDVCGLHNEKMKKALVGTIYGRACNGNYADYPNAKSKKCMGCIVRPGSPRLVMIYHCKTCDKIKKSHNKNN